MESKRIGIIGAGISGVTAAHELKKKGYKHITLLEKNDRVGGKCHSIEYKGKTYEMGTLIGLPSYKNTLKLMEEYGLLEEGPLLERGFFDTAGRKVSQIPLEQVAIFKKEFKRLPDILARYKQLKQPGFFGLSKDLCLPFAKWCEENDLHVIQQIFRHYFTTFGFGNISEIPAAYVLKFLHYDNLQSFIEITHMITWPKGVSELVKRMAEDVEDLRLTSEVTQIRKIETGQIRVKTNQGDLYFDQVIYTAPLDFLPNLVPLEKEEKALLEKIHYEDFRVYAYRVDNIPKLSGYIPENMYPDRKGHMMAWYYRWGDFGSTDLISVYVSDNKGMTNEEMRASIENEFKRLGGKNIRQYMMKHWRHFPHVESDVLEGGFYEELEKMQGNNGIYFAGEIMNFSTLENCVIYSKYLIDRYF